MKKLNRPEIKPVSHRSNSRNRYEFVVIGAGPAGILTAAALLKKGISPQDILWVDNEFKVGALSKQWADVPGNTDTGKYIGVYGQIFAMLEKNYQRGLDKELFFMIHALNSYYACSLKAAAEPLQLITSTMCNIIDSVEGSATTINTQATGLNLEIRSQLGEITHYSARRIILAMGAEAKSVQLPLKEREKVLPLEIALSRANLQEFIDKNPRKLTHIAVVGSSHSAALAVMNLIKANVRVTQFMNKEYRFAATVYDDKGVKHIQYENTGLKGQVAAWTKHLLANQKQYAHQWQSVMGELDDLSKYSHIVCAIGLKPADTLEINGGASSQRLYNYNKKTTETAIPGIFVVGAGYPLQVRDFSGEIENNVGITKFWPDYQKMVEIWIKKPAISTAFLDHGVLFFPQQEARQKTPPIQVGSTRAWAKL